MKKRILAIVMVATLALSLAACGEKAEEAPAADDQAAAPAADEQAEEPAADEQADAPAGEVANKDKPLVWFNRQPSNSSTGRWSISPTSLRTPT